jgi:L-fucose mutarotase
MLKNIPPLLTPDALHALASMGHGDELAIVDANFPAARLAARGPRLVQLPGTTSAEVLQAVLALLPLDDFASPAAWTMQVVGDATALPPAVAELEGVLESAGEALPGSLERFAFYERAGAAFLIVQSGEQRKYGNLLLRKGVLATD